jgi:hypothetical protein
MLYVNIINLDAIQIVNFTYGYGMSLWSLDNGKSISSEETKTKKRIWILILCEKFILFFLSL